MSGVWKDDSLRFARDGNDDIVVLYDSPEFGRVVCATVWKEGGVVFVEMPNALGAQLIRRVIDAADEFFGIDR